MTEADTRALLAAAVECMWRKEQALYLEWRFSEKRHEKRWGEGERPWRSELDHYQAHLINVLEEIGAYDFDPLSPPVVIA